MSAPILRNTRTTVAALGLASLLGVNSALADSESPSFSNATNMLTLPLVSVDDTVWYSDVELELNFSTGEFRLLAAEGAEEDTSFERRLAAIEALVVDDITVEEEQDITTRLEALEQEIVTAISTEGSTLKQRISALENILWYEVPTTSLIPGRYTDPSGWCYELTGPFAYDSARVTYFIQSCDSTTTFVAEIISGPVENHPQMGDRLSELSMPDNRNYGLVTARTNDVNSPIWYWSETSVVGVRQSGNILTMDIFTEHVDAATAFDTVTLTKSTVE